MNSLIESNIYEPSIKSSKPKNASTRYTSKVRIYAKPKKGDNIIIEEFIDSNHQTIFGKPAALFVFRCFVTIWLLTFNIVNLTYSVPRELPLSFKYYEIAESMIICNIYFVGMILIKIHSDRLTSEVKRKLNEFWRIMNFAISTICVFNITYYCTFQLKDDIKFYEVRSEKDPI